MEVYAALLPKTAPAPGGVAFPDLEFFKIEFNKDVYLRPYTVWTGDAENTERLICLVKKCYQIAKRYPKVLTSIKGSTAASQVKSFDRETYAYERSKEWIKVDQPLRSAGYSYSEGEIKDFGNGTSNLLKNLGDQIEFPDVFDGRFKCLNNLNMQFQMEFARLWQKLFLEDNTLLLHMVDGRSDDGSHVDK